MKCWLMQPFSFTQISPESLSAFISLALEWKPQSQKTNQNDHMDYSLVKLNETTSHSV